MQSRTACGGKKSETLLSGKVQRPGDLRGDVIADGARQDAAHRAERCPGGASLWSGVYPSREFAIQQLFTLSIDQFRGRFPPLCTQKHCGSPKP